MSYDKTKKDCPRGFRWQKKNQKCVPEGSDVSDKLIMKYERYFFKEGKEMSKIKNAERLVDLAFDESFEVFGKAVKAERKAERILDAIEEGIGDMAKGAAKAVGTSLAVSGAIAGAGAASKRMSARRVCLDRYKPNTPEYRRCMHRMVHGEGKEVDYGKGTISTSGRPYDHPKKMRVTTDVEECGMMGGGSIDKGIGDEDIEMGPDDYGFEAERGQGPEKEDNPRKYSNDINHVPNQSPKALYQSIRNQMLEFMMMSEDKKAEYKAYFNNMLKKFGVSSPKELDDDKKKEFFDAVDRNWKAQNESWVNQLTRQK